MAPKKDAVKAKAGSKPVPKSTADKKAAPKAADAKKAPLRQVKKAQSAQKKVVKGRFGTRVKKPRTSVQFSRPRTFRPVRNPKYPEEDEMITFATSMRCPCGTLHAGRGIFRCRRCSTQLAAEEESAGEDEM